MRSRFHNRMTWGVVLGIMVLALALAPLALASDVTVTSVVDVTAPTGSVTLAPGESGPITINMEVTGNQDGTATFQVNRSWILSGGTFTGSDPETFTVPPRAAQSPANIFSTTGTVTVAEGQSAGTFTMTVSAINITNDNKTGGKLGDGSDSSYQVTVTAPPPPPTNSPPSVSVTGVTKDANYEFGSVPAATCEVTDAEDGPSSFAATLSAITGPYASDGIGQQTASCSYTDGSGLSDSASVTYSIVDPSAPGITYTLDPASPDSSDGWYTGDVTLIWTVTEDESPSSVVKTDCVDQNITADQVETTYSCSATSAGGSTGPVSVSIKRDATAPTISANASPAANGAGWNNTDVAVSFTCSDATSGIASCGPDQTLTSDGAGQLVTGNAVDNAGNSASTEVSVNIDKTAPVISFVSRTPVNGNGWNNGDVTVTWSCTDSGSGVKAANVSQTVSAEGENQSAIGTCEDLAGNTASDTQTEINIDKTAPTASASASPAPNGNGWNNSDVTVSFSGDDALSGIDFCSDDVILSTEGAGQSASGICTDKAGNVSASATASGINIDKTAPSVTLVGGPADGGTYYFGFVPAAPTCSASDALSGLDGSCSLSGYSAALGSNTVSASATDKAGNSASASATYTVSAWTLTGFYQPVDMNGFYNTIKGGSTVPLKFEVFAGPTELTATSVVQSFVQTKISCDGTAPQDDIEVTTTGGTSLRYDTIAGQFVQNWQTPKSPGQCYRVTMTTQDGSPLVAFFKLK